jgi:hypothetical protein
MRATPLTLLSPIPWWWALWIRVSWRAVALLRLTGVVAGPLRRLEFIHFARWTLLPGRRRLLFLTTFDGSSIQYIDAFVRVVPGRINGLYWGATGFPGPHRFGPVKHYIEAHSHPVDHFWIAHPQASTRMVNQALQLADLYARFEPRLDGADAKGFGREWRKFLTAAQRCL